MNDRVRIETSVVGGDRPGDPGSAISRFHWLLDGLFLAACALYAANRWWIKPHVASRFFHDYFNDLLLIPCALPVVLQVQAWLGLRPGNVPPRLGEILFHLAVWSVLFEGLGPLLIARATGDPWDIFAYAAGAAVAFLWWNRRQLTNRIRGHEL